MTVKYAAETTDNAVPILRWAGSKKTVLHNLESCIPESYKRYVELFAGSACLFFRLRPEEAIIADNNHALINFYKTFAKQPKEIIAKFQSFDRDKDLYYSIRERISYEDDPIIKASYFLFLNRNCFNGIYRTNSSGKFNVPFSSNGVARYPSREELLIGARLLSKAKLKCGDFFEIAENVVQADDFVYLDPPYYVPDTRIFKEYSEKSFALEDFERLSSLLSLIDKRGAMFMLSYPDCKIARQVAASWNRTRFRTRRIIASNASARRGVYELLITNY